MREGSQTVEARDCLAQHVSLRGISPALGAELQGFDAAMIGAPELAPLLHRALLDHQLLLIRGVDLDASSFRRFAFHLGTLRRVPHGMRLEPGMTDVQRLTNLGDDGEPTGVHPDPYSLYWHSDGSATAIPSRYTLLYSIRAARSGGETSFATMYAACAALPDERRRALIGRMAIHDPDIARHVRHGDPIVGSENAKSLRRRLALRARFVARMLSSATVRHPVIRTHEETGRACLFLGDHAWRVTRCRWPKGVRLVDELNAFATSRPEWTYVHAWEPGDLLIWDNRCVLHRGAEYDAAREARVLLRAVVNGTCAPIAAEA